MKNKLENGEKPWGYLVLFWQTMNSRSCMEWKKELNGKKTLSQDLEAEIENINELINSIYYQDIRTYDTATEMFQREMEQRMVRESEVLYSTAIYDADGSSLWHSEKLPDRNKAEVKQEDWFQNAQKNIETIHYGEKTLVQPDKARYVYEISRYIEYVENGNMKSGVLLL